MRTYRKFQDALIDDLRSDPEQAYAYAYLQVAFEAFDQDGDTEHLMLALRNVTEARRGAGAGASRWETPAFTRRYLKKAIQPLVP